MTSDADSYSYIFEVPGDIRLPMAGRNDDGRRLLLGPSPVLHWEPFTPEPTKLYARVTLTAVEKRGANADGIAFTIDRGLIDALRPGDAIHVLGSPMVGLAIRRGNQLIAAAGSGDALTSMPLDPDIDLSIPGDLVQEAARIFRTRDPRYEVTEFPVEVSISGETRIMRWGAPTMPPFEVYVAPSAVDKFPGVGIERQGGCRPRSAEVSADLMDKPYEVVGGFLYEAGLR